MPPKQGPSKKTTEKVKAKIVEVIFNLTAPFNYFNLNYIFFLFIKNLKQDKTFGLKNKKGAKQQKFIQQVQKQVTQKGVQNRPRDV